MLYELLEKAKATGGTDAVIEQLQGADINNLNRALFWSARAGYVEISQAILNLGANPNLTDTLGYHLTCYVGKKGHVDILKILIDSGADVTVHNNETMRNAISKGHYHFVAELLTVPGQLDFIVKNHPEVLCKLKNFFSNELNAAQELKSKGYSTHTTLKILDDYLSEHSNPILYQIQKILLSIEALSNADLPNEIINLIIQNVSDVAEIFKVNEYDNHLLSHYTSITKCENKDSKYFESDDLTQAIKDNKRPRNNSNNNTDEERPLKMARK